MPDLHTTPATQLPARDVANAFRTRDGAHLYPFVEDDTAAYGYGHTNRWTFADAVNTFDHRVGLTTARNRYKAVDVRHAYAQITANPDPSHPISAWLTVTDTPTPTAVPITWIRR